MAEVGKGLVGVVEVCDDRYRRTRELHSQGTKVMGYLCIYPVLEMLTALDIIPFRVLGEMSEPITEADAYMPTVNCPFLRSCLDIGLKGKDDFLDGMVTSHICDVGSTMSSLWNYAIKPPFTHHIDTPHTVHEAALVQERGLLDDYRRALEAFAGQSMTDDKLVAAIALHNEQRAMVRELYELKKQTPPRLSGAETVQVVKALQSLPVEEANRLLREVITEVTERSDGPAARPARLLIWGSIIDDTAMLDMIEGLDANVVMDDTCVGMRAFADDVPVTDDPLDGLAHHYLVDIRCPRTFRSNDFNQVKKDYAQDLEARFGYLKEYIEDWQADGVILESVRYCDTHGYDVPALTDYLESLDVPCIYLEHDYTEGALAPLKTRVQGFLEIIGG